MLGRLEYNLFIDIVNMLPIDIIKEIINSFWNDLIRIYKLMLESDKLKSNIKQLTTFITNIQTKLNLDLDLNLNINLITNVNDSIIQQLIERLNKFIIENYQHLVLTYQIKTEEITKDKYSEIENENEQIDEFSQIKELLLMIVENVETFEMPSSNKLLLLDFIDKYDIYINENNKNGNLDEIQQICSIISDINDSDIISMLNDKLSNDEFRSTINYLLANKF
jgi:hypothetical protein